MNQLHAISIHEAGHAFAFLAMGTRVDEIFASDTDGYCKADLSSPVSIVPAYAGAMAESLLLGHRFEDRLSEGDLLIAQKREGMFELEMGRAVTRADRAHWRDLATAVVLNNEPELRALAAELRDRRAMGAGDLARNAHTGNALWRFGHLYPRAEARHTQRRAAP